MLQDISAHVTQLYNRGFGYTPITQAIAGCSNEIDRYLADYSVVFSSLKIVCIYSLFGFVSFHLKCKVNT